MSELSYRQPEFTRDSMERTDKVLHRLEIHDIDRNLLDTNKFAKMMELALKDLADEDQSINVISDNLEFARSEVERTGGSFDNFSWIQTELNNSNKSQDEVERILGKIEGRMLEMAEENRSAILYPGAEEIINTKFSDGMARAFVTRGGERLQQLKLRAMGVDIDKEMFMVVQDSAEKKTKAQMCCEAFVPEEDMFIFRWLHNVPDKYRQDDGSIKVEKIFITEDKLSEIVHLQDLPEGKATGYWNQLATKNPHQLGEAVPKNIVVVPNLSKVPYLERMQYPGLEEELLAS